MTTLLLFLSMPQVLGSVISFAVMLTYIPIIAKRICNEEQVLEEGLDGSQSIRNGSNIGLFRLFSEAAVKI